jgi:hypothetical protein
MAIEIVDLPSYKMVDLSSSLCKRLTEGTIFWGDEHPIASYDLVLGV